MIFFDVTKTGRAGHHSGLTRVSSRLRHALGDSATSVVWNRQRLELLSGVAAGPTESDWFFTSELFSHEERPGFSEFLARKSVRSAALFHDAIPLRHPHTTWPQSVARHPSYMKLLAGFDRAWAVSEASRKELVGFWRWQGVEQGPSVEVFPLGSDFDGQPRIRETVTPAAGAFSTRPALLCLGILEPRKNQTFLLDVCRELWAANLTFDLHIVGRVNPHFGPPVVQQIAQVRREHAGLHFHEAAPDAAVAQLFQRVRATVFPTLAEGCGLPLLESLWKAVPCVHTDLPVLRENGAGGGCVAVAANDRQRWAEALRGILSDNAHHARLVREAATRPLPTWAEAADVLRSGLR